MDISISPPAEYCFGYDGLRNKQIYGLNDKPHTEFQFRISGDVCVNDSNCEEDANEDIAMIFNHPHGLNVAGECIRAYYEKLCEEEFNKVTVKNNYDKATVIMHNLYKDFIYEAGSTTIKTSAEEAFKLGKGVCQDYAHIFIALAHLAKIPARYVTGLIVGEGESHAWIEILDNNKWYGFDPTNNELVGDKYIKIGVGRDAHDCTINRGIMHGGGLHTQSIKVNVVQYEK